MIKGVSQVIVPVNDQERAKGFWTDRAGFDLVTDARYGDGERGIEVSPPDGAPLLVLSLRPADELRREIPDELPHSPVFFTCDAIQETYRELTDRGVRFPPAADQDGLRLVGDVRGRGGHPLCARAASVKRGRVTERPGDPMLPDARAHAALVGDEEISPLSWSSRFCSPTSARRSPRGPTSRET